MTHWVSLLLCLQLFTHLERNGIVVIFTGFEMERTEWNRGSKWAMLGDPWTHKVLDLVSLAVLIAASNTAKSGHFWWLLSYCHLFIQTPCSKGKVSYFRCSWTCHSSTSAIEHIARVNAVRQKLAFVFGAAEASGPLIFCDVRLVVPRFILCVNDKW